MLEVQVAVDGTDLRPQGRLEGQSFAHDHGHPDVELSQRGRDLGRDPATADDGHLPCREGRGPDGVGIVEGPEAEDARQVGAGHGQRPRLGARRQQQSPEAEAAPVIGADLASPEVQVGGSSPGQDLDPVEGPGIGRLDPDVATVLRPAQVVLGERRPLVGHLGLLGQHDDAPVEALLAQVDRRARRAEARPHDDDGAFGHAASAGETATCDRRPAKGTTSGATRCPRTLDRAHAPVGPIDARRRRREGAYSSGRAMPALLFWVLLLGGIATTVAAAALSADIEFEVALALGGLLATLLGAVGLLLSRVAGDAPSALRPPGATGRINLPMGPAPSASGSRRAARRRSREAQPASAGPGPVTTAIPTGPKRAGISRTPFLVAAFAAGVAWELTNTPTSSGPLDVFAGMLLVAAPIALVMAIATRVMVGRAWSPAVTVALAGLSLLVGAFATDFVETLLA